MQSNKIIELERGGHIVNTKLGPVQFGVPPETIKDCMTMGIQIPGNQFDKYELHAVFVVVFARMPINFIFRLC